MRILSPSVALLRTQSDDRLVALARAGHETAFTAIVERYRKPILTACRRFLPEGRAEDAVQQTFVAAWRALQRGDAVRELRPWLYRIARNTALNALRTPGYDAAELQESLRVTEAPQDELERREAIRRTLAGLAALPERQREALLRSAVEGTAHADIARDIGLSEGAARQLVLRARTNMRSAASAVMPLPLIEWIASLGGQPTVARVAEVAAGAGGAGVAATLVKAGAVVAVAGTAVAGPAIVDRPRERPTTAEARSITPEAKATAVPVRAVATAAPVQVVPPAPARTAEPTRTARPVRSAKRVRTAEPSQREHEGSGQSGHSGQSGPESGGSDSSGPSDGGSGSSGGSGDSGDSGSDSSGSGSSGSGSGGSGGAVELDDHSGQGSGESERDVAPEDVSHE